MDRKAERATFEDTVQEQKKLKKTLKELKEKNTPIDNHEKDKEWLEEKISRSCLGLQNEYDISIRTKVSGKTRPNDRERTTTTTIIGSLTEMIEMALSSTTNRIKVYGEKKDEYKEVPTGEIEIRELWKEILYELKINTFPDAQKLAHGRSVEREHEPDKSLPRAKEKGMMKNG